MGTGEGGRVEDHYASEGIAARTLSVLRAAQSEPAPVIPDVLAPLDHFHGRGLEALASCWAEQPVSVTREEQPNKARRRLKR